MGYKKDADFDTVDEVVDRWLCTSCGACAGVCPHDSIEMKIDEYGIYVPEIDEESCIGCGLCVQVCPGHEFDYVEHQKSIFGTLPENVALGNHRKIYAGYTNIEDILEQVQSGGFVSTFLLCCLEKGVIDGAVVTKWKEDSPFEPKTYIARDKEEVMKSVGSKYNPVPAASIIETILEEEGKFAFVGTSCQIQGMRKAEKIYPELVEKIRIYIGLHCLGVFTYHFHDQMCHKIGKSKDEIKYFRFRSKEWRGWPCDMRMETKDGETFDIDASKSRLNPRPFFTDWRCKLCFDKANEFSDISCGDCRIKDVHSKIEAEGYDLKKGVSEFIVRTERGEELVEDLISDGYLQVWEVEPKKIASSIGMEKKLGIEFFFKIAKYFNRGVPKYGVEFYHPDHHQSLKRKILEPWTILWSFNNFYLCYGLNKFKFFRALLKRTPHSFFEIVKTLGKNLTYWEILKTSNSLGRRILAQKDEEDSNKG
ncbi:MAG: Coenzyme F420 hydrogenase/dehydrogenase, beta subunit C-terminal domain [Candidatus Saliniplasma sp.]